MVGASGDVMVVGMGLGVFAGMVVGTPVGAVSGVVVGCVVGVATAVGSPPPLLHAPRTSSAMSMTSEMKGTKVFFTIIPPEIYTRLQRIDDTPQLFVPGRIMYNFTTRLPCKSNIKN